MNTPKEITVALLEVVVMPNGEVLCAGECVGWVCEIGKYLTPKQVPRDVSIVSLDGWMPEMKVIE